MNAERQTGESAEPAGRVGRGDRSAWAYVSGLVAARLERLMDASAMVELLETSDTGERLARVRQTALGSGFSQEGGWLDVGSEFERLFDERLADWGRACPDASVVDFFGLQEECRLLKRYAKSRLGSSVGGGVQAGGARRAPEQSPGRDDEQTDGGGAAFRWEEALFRVEALQAEVRETRRPADVPLAWLVDLIFDGELLRAQAALAERIAHRWSAGKVAQAIRWWVELQCLLVVARARRGTGRVAPVRQHFGFPVEADWLAWIYDLDETDAVGARLQWGNALDGAVGGALAAGEADTGPAAEGLTDEEIERVTRRGDQALMEAARAVRWVPFGPEPLFGYLWGLRAEADNLKQVVGGLQAGVAPEVIRERLRPTYV